MMILADIRPFDARMALVELGEAPTYGSANAGEVEDLLNSMGFYFALEETLESARTEAELSWSYREGCVTYRASVPHDANAIQWIDPYIAAVLATYGPSAVRAVADLRLAVYELCRNVTDHGRPHVSNPRIRIVSVLSSARIRIAIEDDCQHFNPVSHASDTTGRKAERRERRGYGLSLVRRMVDDFQHTALPHGNRTVITKDVRP
jgi:anti-sigma regulatory factor (Ser/Thr protein kinase)